MNDTQRQDILVIAEHDNKRLASSTLHAIHAAKQLPGEIVLYIAGFECQSVIQMASRIAEVAKIIKVDAPCYAHGLAENIAANVLHIAKFYRYILAAATTYGKNILPRIAAKLDVSQVSEITKIVSADRFIRPIYAGNALAEVQSLDPIIVISIRPTAFDAVVIRDSDANVHVEALATVDDLGASEFIEQTMSKAERPELTSARMVVSGGRGLQSKENFKIIEDLADKLGAAIGASRAAVDAGFVPNDYQVGQTGKVVAPDLYIAVGISGAIQHLAGMKDSKIIVAINKDREAPIFQIADYGLVGDLFEIVPILSQQLTVRMGKNKVE
jgi:electron transfer flavoprotein alpha subunit